ncbi:MAG: type II secretion system protein [Candidatus Liptonbacteria bacterium]|nr:type II secretion system protein [Candidatus Liptonbacteria bacterium]
MKKASRKNRGFTLLELLLAFAVISALFVIIAISLTFANAKARNARRLSDANQITSAIQLYRHEHSGDPPGEDGVEYTNGDPNWIPNLVPQYMRVVPSDPIDKDQYKYHYIRNGVNYEVSAFMEARGNDASCGDGGPGGCDYYENTSGEFLTIYNPGASGWNFTSGSTTPPLASNTCATFTESQKYYFDLCATEGYDNVCLDKATGEHQGCTRNTYNDCTLYNTNKDNNLLCAVSGISTTTSALSVLAPSNNIIWVRGMKGQVFWNENTTHPVTINLLKAGSFYRTLASNAPAVKFSGYNFQNLYPDAYYAAVSLPVDVSLGGDYQIEVLDSSDSSIKGISNGMFAVVPFYDPVTVQGKFIDAFTLQPIADTQIVSGSSSVYTNSDGAFSLSATTNDISENASKSLFSSWPACHISQGAGFFNYYTAIYASFNPFDLMRNGTNVPIYSSSIDLGDIRLWPAANLIIHSDIPVQYKIGFPDEQTSFGNTSFNTTQSGSNVLPLDYDIQVKLTDQLGNVYAAPTIRLPDNWGCNSKTLNFSVGNFVWR